MRPASVLVFSIPLFLTGCSSGPTVSPQPLAGLARSGVVQGGQQPIVGANIQLYAVGTSGDASAATKLLTSTVQSDQYGNFNGSVRPTTRLAST